MLHTLPCTQVGFGASGFGRKLRSLLHAASLNHFTGQCLINFIDEIVAFCQDYGTEKRISILKPTRLAGVCPHFKDTPQNIIDASLSVVFPDKIGVQPRRVVEDSGNEGGDDRLEHDDVFEDPGLAPALAPAAHANSDEDDVFENVVRDRVEYPGHAPAVPAPGPAADSHEDDDDVFENARRDRDNDILNVGHILETPPSHHITDTATTGLAEVMPHWKDSTFTSQQICKIIRKRNHKNRLLETCFTDGLAMHFQGAITRFRGWIHLKRWATIAFSIPEIRRIERPMRLFWSKEKFYLEDGKQKEETMKLVSDVDDGITSPFYWAYLVVQEEIVCVLRKLTTFVELCPCHFKFVMEIEGLEGALPEDVLKDMARQWQSCPFRGMVVAELAQEFFKLVAHINQTSSAQLVAKLPPDISVAERQTCLKEFESGRAHINFCFVVKLSHLHTAPYAAFQMAHLDFTVAWRAGDVCMASASEHPRIRRLQQPKLTRQYNAWKNGSDIFSDDLMELCDFVAEGRFAFASDRPGEGQHAKLKKTARSAPTHTEQYASYFMRSPEIEVFMNAQPDFLPQLSWCFAQSSNPRRCTELMGLSGHPSLIRAHEADAVSQKKTRFYRSVMHAKVIYHADAFSLYKDKMPELEFWQYDGGGDAPVRGVADVDSACPGPLPDDGGQDLNLGDDALNDLLEPGPGDGGASPLAAPSSPPPPVAELALAPAPPKPLLADSSDEFACMMAPYLRGHMYEVWHTAPGTIFKVELLEQRTQLYTTAALLRSSVEEALRVDRDRPSYLSRDAPGSGSYS